MHVAYIFHELNNTMQIWGVGGGIYGRIPEEKKG
jgi:hypothetical protein